MMTTMILKAMRCVLRFCDVPTLEKGLETIGEVRNPLFSPCAVFIFLSAVVSIDTKQELIY